MTAEIQAKRFHNLLQAKCEHGREWVLRPKDGEWIETCTPGEPEALARGIFLPICDCPPPGPTE
jgi:hypothetical protein